MGNICELLINLVSIEAPKLLTDDASRLMALTKRCVAGHFVVNSKCVAFTATGEEAGPNSVV
jgi:hypothetical protein